MSERGGDPSAFESRGQLALRGETLAVEADAAKTRAGVPSLAGEAEWKAGSGRRIRLAAVPILQNYGPRRSASGGKRRC